MKRKLFLLLCALLTMIGVWAQNPGDDMTSRITNPTFTDNADGWTIDGPARYYNGKGFDGTTNFIELTNWGSSWDATISQTVTVPNGYYRVQAAGQMSDVEDAWMKLVANDSEKYFDHNGDKNGNILANGTVTRIGAGVAGWRYTSVIAHVTNGSLEITCVGHSDVAERWANFDAVTLTYLGPSEGQGDFTSVINNWDFINCINNNFPGWTIETSGGNTWVHGETAVEFWNNNLNATFDYHQTVSNLPEGRYTLSASMWSTQGTPNGNSGVYGTSNDVTVFAGVTDDCGDTDLHTYSTDGIFVNNGTLRVGVKNNGARSSNWFGVDWIKLQYVGKVVQDYAVPLPAGGAMAADTWYCFDIAVAGDEYNATATTLGDIICTDDGNTLISAATGNVTLTATDNNFAAKRYYVKSSSANNLEIGVASYTYSVSEATADKAYIQPSQTVTVSFTASTNDPDATLAQDYSGVTFNGSPVACTPTASGFTFEVPEGLAGATAYTLAIPAGAIGYAAGATYNVAQNITLTTPAVYDGIYFLKAAATYDGSSEGTSAAVGKYLARGLNYGTHATLDKYGLPVQITTNSNNETTIQAYDTKRYFFHANSYDCYADQASLAATSYFTVTLNNGKLLIHNNSMDAGTYLKYNTSAADNANIAVFDDGNGTNSGPIIMWTTEDASAHATVMQSYKDGQATAAAAAAYASGNYESLGDITTVSALEAELEDNYIKGDFVKPSTIESVLEKYQGNQPASGNVTETVYSNSIDITEPGFYKFSMQAFYRAGSNNVTQTMHTNGIDFPPVTLFFGNSETQIKSLYDEHGHAEAVPGADPADAVYNGEYYANCMNSALKMFQDGKFHNDVYFYASEPGTYEYGVKYMGWACANMQWFIYSPESVTITSYAAAADGDDYTALQNAIGAYDAATWGFESGEYAPYNNTTAIEKIADARAINPAEDNSKLLVNSLTAYLTLTANATEVNAFGNDGAFSTAKGWENSAWVGTEGDYVGVPNGTTITYGNIAGYTVPLKANTIYELKLRHSGWDGSNIDGGGTVSMLLDEDGLKDATYSGNSSYAKGDDSKYLQETFLFKTGAAGNYVFTLKGNGGRTTVKDFSLVSVPSKVSVEFGASGFATFACDYPVALPDDESVKGYTASIEDATISFNKLTDKLVPANTGVMLSGTPNKEMKLDVVTSADAQSSDFIRGTGAAPGEDDEYYFFAIKKSAAELTFGTFNPATLVVAKNKAYLKIPTGAFGSGAARLTLRFDDTTAINAIETAEVEDGALKDGKYLENGKIVIVKNGVKYGANGQKLN